MNEAAPLGHNNPPSDAETLRTNLELDNQDLISRAKELLEAIERVPETVEDDDTAQRISDFIKQLGTAKKSLEDARKAEKEPHLEAGRIVDAFFKAFIEPLDRGKSQVNSRLSAYLTEKARREEEQRRKEEEERRKAEEARRAAEAPESDDEAPEAEPAPTPAPERPRPAVRGDYGSTTSLRSHWTFEVEDLRAIPLSKIKAYLFRDQAAIEKAIRAYVRDGGRELKGVRIYEEKKAVTS